VVLNATVVERISMGSTQIILELLLRLLLLLLLRQDDDDDDVDAPPRPCSYVEKWNVVVVYSLLLRAADGDGAGADFVFDVETWIRLHRHHFRRHHGHPLNIPLLLPTNKTRLLAVLLQSIVVDGVVVVVVAAAAAVLLVLDVVVIMPLFAVSYQQWSLSLSQDDSYYSSSSSSLSSIWHIAIHYAPRIAMHATLYHALACWEFPSTRHLDYRCCLLFSQNAIQTSIACIAQFPTSGSF
jgi:hypothetical protein